MEIYNENVVDLLGDAKKSLNLLENTVRVFKFHRFNHMLNQYDRITF